MNKKYSLKFKLKLVKRYREGTNSATSIAREFALVDHYYFAGIINLNILEKQGYLLIKFLGIILTKKNFISYDIERNINYLIEKQRFILK